jgi:predicted O-methyltransferase YrrM
VSRDPLAPPLGTYIARAVKGALSDPRDGAEKAIEKCAARWERVVRHGRLPQYQADEEWERRLHELIDAPWPCPEAEEFASAWAGARETMAQHGLRVGRRNYGGDDDADPGLARALWCLVRHLHPGQVVETGVAHGLSSRMILEALQRPGEGRLSSIDLPPMTIRDRRGEVAVAVPERLRERWVYLEGASRRRLPSLVRQVGQIELFVHDSLHSTRNVRWELTTAWRALPPGGVVVVDDVEGNWGFERFLGGGEDREPLWCMADDGMRLFAVARKMPIDAPAHS